MLMQLENLRSYPLAERKRRSGELKLFGWFYDIRRAEVEQGDAERGAFVPVGRGLPESDPESSRDRTPGEPAPTLA